MKIVITGAAGYIGSKLFDSLVKRGHNVIGFDNLFYDQGTLVSKVICDSTGLSKFFVEDVTSWSENLKDAIKNADIIIPLVALVGAPLCDKYPELAHKINYEWFSKLLPHLKGQHVIYPNTNSGYGSTGEEICTEETPSNPLSLYARTKQDAEDLLMTYEKSTCFRLATVFGWSYRPRTDLLINNLTKVALETGKISVFDGHFRRNYIHVDDIVSAFNFIIDKITYQKSQEVYGIFNLGNDSLNTTKHSLVKEICSIVGSDFVIENNRTDPDKRDYLVSSQKLSSLGWNPRVSLRVGVNQMINFYKVMSKSDEFRCRNY
jgi:nucleoside-diphosphate-sugar epimerase